MTAYSEGLERDGVGRGHETLQSTLKRRKREERSKGEGGRISGRVSGKGREREGGREECGREGGEGGRIGQEDERRLGLGRGKEGEKKGGYE